MHITQVDVYACKLNYHYRICGHADMPGQLPGTDYYLEPKWTHLYSSRLESCLVRIGTNTGLVGWGEAQAPLVPETTASLIGRMLGPAVIGQDPLAHEVIYDRLRNLMDVRGHFSGFMLDAIAGIDIALWDLKGQHLNAPVWRLLGGQFRSQLPAYVSGLRMPTREQRCQEAKRAAARNFAGIKLNLGEDPEDDVEEAKAIRAAAPGLRIFADMIGKYNAFDAIRVGRALEALRVEWMESATHPQDVSAHRSLAAQLDMPLAVGEPLRSEREFLPWFQAAAIDIAQPDIARTGITGGVNIAKLAHAYHLPVALHVGVSTAIGVAATWHVASALPNFYIQEHQESIFEVANRLLRTPLVEDKGLLVVPHGPGLGIQVDGEYVQAHSVEHYTADESGPRKNAVAGNTHPLALVEPSAAQAS